MTYSAYADKSAAKSPLIRDMLFAFLSGGVICLGGQAMNTGYSALINNEKTVGMLVSLSLILLAVLLTGFGVFDRIARYAGAGTLVPITGFANAMASPAIDAKSEGWILGVGAKMFNVAGPVILYGTAASVVYGLIYYVVGLIGG